MGHLTFEISKTALTCFITQPKIHDSCPTLKIPLICITFQCSVSFILFIHLSLTPTFYNFTSPPFYFKKYSSQPAPDQM